MEKTLKEHFGLLADVWTIPAPVGLPIYLTSGRTFFRVTAEGVSFLLVALAKEDRFGVVALEKQLEQYRNHSGMNAAYMLSGLTKVQRDSLMGHRIPFIVVPDQVYLPFLGVSLNNRFQRLREEKRNRFTPAAQCLFLYFLYHGVAPILKKDAAKALHLTKTSITRASAQLAAMGLLTEEAKGTEVWMRPTASGKAYYLLGRPNLINPVSRVITVGGKRLYPCYPLAGESALAERSMLIGPNMKVVAIGNRDPMLSELREVDEKWNPEDAMYRVEIWKYNPNLFSEKSLVDPISMAASLLDNGDERVQGELEEYMEGIQW